MSESFIKIDSLKHLEISRGTYPTNQGGSALLRTDQKSALQFTVLTLC